MKPRRRRTKRSAPRSPWLLGSGIALLLVGVLVGGFYSWEKGAAGAAASFGHDLVHSFKNNFAAGDIGACLALEAQLRAELPDGYLFGFQVDRVEPRVFRERLTAKIERHVTSQTRRLLEHLYAGRTTAGEVDSLFAALSLEAQRQSWQEAAAHHAFCQEQRSLAVELPTFESEAIFDLLRERFAGAAVLHELAQSPASTVGILRVYFERGELVEYHEAPWSASGSASSLPAASIWLPRLVRLVIEVECEQGSFSWGSRRVFSEEADALPEELWAWEQDDLEESLQHQAIKQLAAASPITFQPASPPSDSVR